ncbi:MAG: hypothetical protein M3141_07840 [Actinomycetota bacterium]|nr:hypothetical protein [Actinomycetota bacterium]
MLALLLYRGADVVAAEAQTVVHPIRKRLGVDRPDAVDMNPPTGLSSHSVSDG